jgi:CTP synthase (UTP-ammonia lyase)
MVPAEISSIKIAIIGDYNFTFNTHHAVNLAIDHASHFLEIEINYYWIRLQEASQLNATQLRDYDGIWICHGPFKNPFFLNGIIEYLLQQKLPVFITGEGFQHLIEVLINKHNLNPNGEKLISDNLVSGMQFDEVEIVPHSKALIELYENHYNKELIDEVIHVEAYNGFEEIEIFSLVEKHFFVVCGFCPQITSTREIPHPLIYTFIKASIAFRSK